MHLITRRKEDIKSDPIMLPRGAAHNLFISNIDHLLYFVSYYLDTTNIFYCYTNCRYCIKYFIFVCKVKQYDTMVWYKFESKRSNR